MRTKKIESVGFKKFVSLKYSFISLMNLLVAYVIVAIVEIIALLIQKHFGLKISYDFLESPFAVIKWFLTGLSGPGSYYVLIMIQLIVFLPIIYLIFKKSRYVGLISCLLFNLAYDLAVYYININPIIYRLLIFRYTFIIGFGIFLALSIKDKKDDIIAAVLFVIGLMFLVVNAFVVTVPLFQGWKSTSMLCAPYVYGIMYFLMKWLPNMKYHKIFIFGKASYHIFLTQMVYYYFCGEYLTNTLAFYIPNPLNNIICMVISVVITFSIGILFYFCETKLRKLIRISH